MNVWKSNFPPQINMLFEKVLVSISGAEWILGGGSCFLLTERSVEILFLYTQSYFCDWEKFSCCRWWEAKTHVRYVCISCQRENHTEKDFCFLQGPKGYLDHKNWTRKPSWYVLKGAVRSLGTFESEEKEYHWLIFFNAKTNIIHKLTLKYNTVSCCLFICGGPRHLSCFRQCSGDLFYLSLFTYGTNKSFWVSFYLVLFLQNYILLL